MRTPGPLGTGERTVPADWIDYNGHMMDGYYAIAFTEATDALLDYLGLGAAYREETGSSIYTVESHLCFFRSVRAGVRLRYASQLLGVDAKRLHAFHRMTDAATGDELAANEVMLLHVDIATERVTPMPPPRRQAAEALAAGHAALPSRPPRAAASPCPTAEPPGPVCRPGWSAACSQRVGTMRYFDPVAIWA
jgi:acyl-CoA thioester hydrolase